MVYCGIPSKACAECRTRRTKCDYLKPSCSQCIRMGRKCKGYRDPVAVLFRDESKGLAAKRERVTGTKKAPSTAFRKSSQEIDKALAACSTMFGNSSISDSDQIYDNSLLSGSIVRAIEKFPSIEDQGVWFLDTDYAMDEPDALDENFQTLSKMDACDEAREAFLESVSSLGVAGLTNYCGASDSMIDSRLRNNTTFIDSWCTASQDREKFVSSDFGLEFSQSYCDNSTTVNPKLLDFDLTAKQSTSTTLPLDLETEYWTSLFLTNITCSIESQAPCYFFANYVLENTSYSEGFLDYLPGLCENSVTNSFLLEAVTALGLVGLAMKRHSSTDLNSARRNYVSALNQLNVTLTSKDGALTDQALTTVFLLGLYETNICSAPQNIRAWTKHIRGAIAMLQLRGKKQLAYAVGRQIFVQWRNQIVAYCLHRRSTIPEFILEWCQEIVQHETSDEAIATSLCITTAKICALRANMKYFRNYSKSGTVVPWALAIDAELADWADNCPDSHKYTSVTPTETSEFIYEDYFHVYSSITVATAWNEHRRMRMLCHELLLQHLPHLIEHQAEYTELEISTEQMKCQLYDSKEIIERLAKEICASVPFHFGVHLEDASQKSATLAPKAVWGNLLLRPLYMAAEPRFVSNHVRRWVIGRFEKIAEVMGIKLATALAHLVKIGVDPDEWENTLDK